MSSNTEAEIWGELRCNPERSSESQHLKVKVRGLKFVIGRAKDCDLQVCQKMISGHHCYLQRDADGKVFLYDLSTNGTFINKSVKVRNGESHELKDDDVIHLVLNKKQPSLDYCCVFKIPNDFETIENEAGDEHSTLEMDDTFEVPEDERCDQNLEPKAKMLKRESSTVDSSSAQDTEYSTCNNALSSNNNTASSVSVQSPPISHVDAVENEAAKNKNRDSLEEALICCFCLDILHDPVSLQPCMHCYCAGCYSNWMGKSKICPQCRVHVDRIGRNYVVQNMVDAYIKKFPEKARSLSDKKRLDAQNKITSDMIKLKKVERQQEDCYFNYDDDDDDDDDDDNDDSNEEDYFGNALSLEFIPICRQCPQTNNQTQSGSPSTEPDTRSTNNSTEPDTGRSGSTNINTSPANLEPPAIPSCSTQTPGNNENTQLTKTIPDALTFTCNFFKTMHVTCCCCWQKMPCRRLDREKDNSIPPQTCSLCLRTYCHMYWGCQKQGCYGCLNKFVDMNFGDKCMKDIINENSVESLILNDYLKSHGHSWRNLLADCLMKLSEGSYHCSYPVTPATIVCYSCGLKCFRELAYQYRCDIPIDELPDSVSSRENCYWGKNCRTQKHKESHAKHFNHVCEQTRFV